MTSADPTHIEQSARMENAWRLAMTTTPAEAEAERLKWLLANAASQSDLLRTNKNG